MGADVSHLVPPPGTNSGERSGFPCMPASTYATAGGGISSNAPTSMPKDFFPAGENGMGEGMLILQLTQLLNTRPKNCLLLSDLGALLPTQLRSSVKEKGGLRTWVQKYPMLFEVSGHPGKEIVRLLVGEHGEVADMTSQQDRWLDESEQAAKKQAEEEEASRSVQLRGLPYRANTADVMTWLGKHSANLSRGEQSIQLVLNRDGRPSGFARVLFASAVMAMAARDELHNSVMRTSDTSAPVQERYVEIFLYSERPNKLRFRKVTLEQTEHAEAPENHPDTERVTEDVVVDECRVHMKIPGKGQLLLSMLGVALSPPCRLFLKKSELGLKHMLSQHPQEFSIEGAKGREWVTYLPQQSTPPPTMPVVPQTTSSTLASTTSVLAPKPSPVVVADRRNPPKTASGQGQPSADVSHLRQKMVPKGTPGGLTSPVPMPTSPPGLTASPPYMSTPSEWGSPNPFGFWQARLNKTRHCAKPQKVIDTQVGFPFPKIRPEGLPSYQMGDVFGPAWGWEATPPWLFGDNTYPPCNLPPWMIPPAMELSPDTTTLASDNSIATESQCALSPRALRIRGLPLGTKEQDILAFLARHGVVEMIAENDQAVKIYAQGATDRFDGTASQHAIVNMKSQHDAKHAQDLLRGQKMGLQSIILDVVANSDDGGSLFRAATNEASQSLPSKVDSVSQVLPPAAASLARTAAPGLTYMSMSSDLDSEAWPLRSSCVSGPPGSPAPHTVGVHAENGVAEMPRTPAMLIPSTPDVFGDSSGLQCIFPTAAPTHTPAGRQGFTWDAGFDFPNECGMASKLADIRMTMDRASASTASEDVPSQGGWTALISYLKQGGPEQETSVETNLHPAVDCGERDSGSAQLNEI